MQTSDGGSHEGIHKKVLGPNIEVHEAHRQVISNPNKKIEHSDKNV